jgi:hypothetical protein
MNYYRYLLPSIERFSREANCGPQSKVHCCYHPLRMDCTEKDRLLEAYNHGVTEWAKAVQNLQDAGLGQSRYLELLSLVDDARARTQRAKAAQAKHVAEHGC